MESFSNETEEFLEENVISEVEKKEIISSVNEEFSRFFNSTEEKPSIEKNTKGLIVPLLTGFAIILISAVILLLYLRNFTQDVEASTSRPLRMMSEAEWKILRYYKEQTEQAIIDKNREILIYQNRIADYDSKLATLRRLIVEKREIETFLNKSGEEMKALGFSKDRIELELIKLEEEQISGFSPEMARHYYLSLDEINQEIDRLLEEKSNDEEFLQQQLEELGALEKADRNMSDSIEDEMTLRNNSEQGEADPDILSNPKDFAGMTGAPPENLFPGDETGPDVIRELDNYINAVESASDNKTGERAIENLRDYVDSIPVLTKAYSLLDTRKITDKAEEEKKTIEAEPAALPAERNPDQLGKISKIQFNQIEIDLSEGAVIEEGMPFLIFRWDDDGNRIELGQGQISSLSPPAGRILSLLNTQYKPEIEDLLLEIPEE